MRPASSSLTTPGAGESIARTAQALADQKAIGWFQSRMEFGPRPLGGRSILGDPRSASMQKTLNLRVKYKYALMSLRPLFTVSESSIVT